MKWWKTTLFWLSITMTHWAILSSLWAHECGREQIALSAEWVTLPSEAALATVQKRCVSEQRIWYSSPLLVDSFRKAPCSTLCCLLPSFLSLLFPIRPQISAGLWVCTFDVRSCVFMLAVHVAHIAERLAGYISVCYSLLCTPLCRGQGKSCPVSFVSLLEWRLKRPANKKREREGRQRKRTEDDCRSLLADSGSIAVEVCVRVCASRKVHWIIQTWWNCGNSRSLWFSALDTFCMYLRSQLRLLVMFTFLTWFVWCFTIISWI